MPGTDGRLGKLAAHDVRAMEELWSRAAGGVPHLRAHDLLPRAFDVRTGEVLWETRLGTAIHGFPVTYAAGGKQYVAVPTGLWIFRGLSGQLSPEIYQPLTGNGLYLFTLSDAPIGAEAGRVFVYPGLRDSVRGAVRHTGTPVG